MTSSSNGTPDGTTYPNGTRGTYVGSLLERSASFREGLDHRILSTAPNTLKSGSTSAQSGSAHLLQSLHLDFRTVVADQKLPRHGEIKRTMSSLFGTLYEEPVSVSGAGRHLPSMDEIKRLKVSLNDSSSKARERGKLFGDGIFKMDKYTQNLPRKRSRGDGLSSERASTSLSGGNFFKTSPQTHSNADGVELMLPKAEERAKNAVQNRRIRNSTGEVEARTTSVCRASGPIDRNKDGTKLSSGGPAVAEEKGRGLVTSIDGWEKPQMKKKRSVIKSDGTTNVALSKSIDGDREPNQGALHKLVTDARQRVISSHSSRSGPPLPGPSTGKSDLLSEQKGITGRSLTRNDQDSGAQLNNKRERLAALDKEGATLKSANKSSIGEDDFVVSPTSTAKLNSSARGPRSNPALLMKASLNVHKAQGNSEDWENPSSTNKLNFVGGPVNYKRSKSAHAASPPVAQWGGQRPQKISRIARRSIPVITSHNGTPVSDTVEPSVVSDDALGFTKRMSANASQQIKKGDHGQSTGLSESEESADNKSKDKIRRNGETKENISHDGQKIPTLGFPSRKNKMDVDEHLEDGARRQGRFGQGFTHTGSGIEKLDDAAATKQRSIRMGTERNEGKPGRLPVKKFSELKGIMRSRHPGNSVSSDLPGRVDDDNEELLAAARAALDRSNGYTSISPDNNVYISPFWKDTEPIFSFVSEEDIAYINQQIGLVEESTASRFAGQDYNLDSKGNLEYISLPSTPAAGSNDNGTISNKSSLNEPERDLGMDYYTECLDPLLEELVQGIQVQRGVSICQALLSAIIEEEETDIDNNSGSEGYPYNSHAMYLESERELKSHSQGTYKESSGITQAGERVPNGFTKDCICTYHDEPGHVTKRRNDAISGPGAVYPDFQYSQMCLSDRILLELSEVGLYPEIVPDLAQSEDENIADEICKLEVQLRDQVAKKKNLLPKLQKALMVARESQKRGLIQRALDNLVATAYEKHMACRRSKSSGSKNVNRVARHVALAFVKRTLARCREFEETEVSCFDDPVFTDMFLSIPSYKSDGDCINVVVGEAAANGLSVLSRLQDNDSSIFPKPVQKTDTSGKCSDSSPSFSHLSERSFGKEDPWSNKVKKREVLLDDVVGSITGVLRGSSGPVNSVSSGPKGKRSDRDREGKRQKRDCTTAKIGRPSLSHANGERKNKMKPKQKTTHLSASVNGLLSAPKAPEMVAGDGGKKNNLVPISSNDGRKDIKADAEMEDLPNFQLLEVDVGDFGGQGQDIGSWLNIDDDGLQDFDCMEGLQIPLDDLSEVNMMI